MVHHLKGIQWGWVQGSVQVKAGLELFQSSSSSSSKLEFFQSNPGEPYLHGPRFVQRDVVVLDMTFGHFQWRENVMPKHIKTSYAILCFQKTHIWVWWSNVHILRLYNVSWYEWQSIRQILKHREGLTPTFITASSYNNKWHHKPNIWLLPISRHLYYIFYWQIYLLLEIKA